ncbi:uncharacterized protein DUF2490 [Sphingomonas sp. F9_3S_D5_B_2]
MRRTLLALLFGAAAAQPALAATEDRQIWTTASASFKLSDRWRLSQELVGRFSDNRNGLYEIESNTLIGYRLNKVVTVWAGYTHDPQYSAGDFTVLEHRAREQVTFDNLGQLGPGKINARLRVEQRWREGVDGTGWRARPFIRYSIPLKGKTALNLSNETFVNLNTTTFQKKPGVDRMRNLIAVATPLAKNLTVELGYLNQYGFVRGGPNTMDHVAHIAVSFSR